MILWIGNLGMAQWGAGSRSPLSWLPHLQSMASVAGGWLVQGDLTWDGCSLLPGSLVLPWASPGSLTRSWAGFQGAGEMHKISGGSTQNWPKVTSITFCWTKQVPSPAQIQRVGTPTPPLHGRSCRVLLQREDCQGGKSLQTLYRLPQPRVLQVLRVFCSNKHHLKNGWNKSECRHNNGKQQV